MQENNKPPQPSPALPQPAPAAHSLTRRCLLQGAAASAVALTLFHARPAPPKQSGHQGETALPSLPASAVTLAAPPKEQPFDLADMRLLPGPFRHAQKPDGAYLLFLEPDCLLHPFWVNAGLPPKGEIYAGWESKGVAGHIAGHYLSACAMMYRATGDARFRSRVDAMVADLH